MHGVIDLRSDTVTRPTPAMRRAMLEAEVGDDVLGDDPTVLRLQERIAGILGKEAACFVPSGTMANQAAIRAHTEPGDEIIAHEFSHIYNYEGGAPAALSGCSLRFARGERGLFGPEEIDALTRPIDNHAPRTRLVVIENTNNTGGGAVWPLSLVHAVAERARARGLRLHLDGARLWNACAASGVSPADYAAPFDSVSTCFSKGLGAPVGSAVAGSREFVTRVFRFRKMFGGAMRQSGILAAAALYALDHHRERLVEDHANAKALARGLAGTGRYVIDPEHVETNIVYFETRGTGRTAERVAAAAAAEGVLILATGPNRLRAVTHLDVSRLQIEQAIAVLGRAGEAADP